MKRVKSIIVILSPILFLFLTGCIGVNRQFSQVKDKIMGELGSDYKTEFQFSVGPALIHVSSWLVDVSTDEEYVDDMLREISSVQIGIYNRVEKNKGRASFSTLVAVDDHMKSNGWKYIVRTADGDELTAVYISSDPDEILKKMYVISLEDEKLVIVEVNGNLQKVISYALKEKKFNINKNL
jgi:hypothetical protein